MLEPSACALCRGVEHTPLLSARDPLQPVPGTFQVVECRHCGFAYLNPTVLQLELARAVTGDVFVGDLMDAPFPDQSFDVVTAFHVVEHVPEPVSAQVKQLSDWQYVTKSLEVVEANARRALLRLLSPSALPR